MSSAAVDNQYAIMKEEAIGGFDVLNQHKLCCVVMFELGSSSNDGECPKCHPLPKCTTY